MTYNVFSGTLNLTQSTQSIFAWCSKVVVYAGIVFLTLVCESMLWLQLGRFGEQELRD